MKGRPILGIVGGFMFGLFGGLTLFLYGAIPLQSDLLWILPLVGIVVGLVFAAWAPFGGGGTDSSESTSGEAAIEPPPEPAVATEAPDAVEESSEAVVDVEVHEQGDGQPTE